MRFRLFFFFFLGDPVYSELSHTEHSLHSYFILSGLRCNPIKINSRLWFDLFPFSMATVGAKQAVPPHLSANDGNLYVNWIMAKINSEKAEWTYVKLQGKFPFGSSISIRNFKVQPYNFSANSHQIWFINQQVLADFWMKMFSRYWCAKFIVSK